MKPHIWLHTNLNKTQRNLKKKKQYSAMLGEKDLYM